MGRKSRLSQNPELKAKLDELLQVGSHTQAEIADMLTAYAEEYGLEVKITERVVNRYASAFKDIIAKREERALVVKQWIGKMGDVPDGDFGRVIVEILRQLSFDLSIAVTENGTDNLPESARMLKELAISVERLERSASENMRREAEMERRIREKAMADIDNALESSEKLDKKTLSEIRANIVEKILGRTAQKS